MFASRNWRAVRVSSALADTTQSLQRALASPNSRGQWGERMAEDVKLSRLSLADALALYRNPECFELLDEASRSDLSAYIVAKKDYESLRERALAATAAEEQI